MFVPYVAGQEGSGEVSPRGTEERRTAGVETLVPTLHGPLLLAPAQADLQTVLRHVLSVHHQPGILLASVSEEHDMFYFNSGLYIHVNLTEVK